MDVHIDKESRQALAAEFKWVLQHESVRVLKDVKEILIECSRRFPLHLTIENTGTDNLVKPDKFLIQNTSENGTPNIKGMITLMGDNICEADLNLKVPVLKGHHNAPVVRTFIQPDNCWKLQQLQDAGNFLSKTLLEVNKRLEIGCFHSGREAVFLLNELIAGLNKARTCMVVPKRKTIDELMGSLNKKSLNPALSSDVAVSFYVHATKLVLALYHVCPSQTNKVEINNRFQAEVSVPWFSDVIVMFTAALQQCQQLKDKVTVFAQYPDAPADVLIDEETVKKKRDSEDIILV